MIDTNVVKFTLPAGKYIICDPALLYVDLHLYGKDVIDKFNNSTELLSAAGVITEEDHTRVFGDWYSVLSQIEQTNHGLAIGKEVWATKTKLAYEYGMNTHWANGDYLCVMSENIKVTFYVFSGYIGISKSELFYSNRQRYNNNGYQVRYNSLVDFDVEFDKDSGLIKIGDNLDIITDPKIIIDYYKNDM